MRFFIVHHWLLGYLLDKFNSGVFECVLKWMVLQNECDGVVTKANDEIGKCDDF